MSQYILSSILNFIPYYLGIGFTISILYSAMVLAMRDEESELKSGEVVLAIFFYPVIIYQIIKNYKNGE